MFTRDTMLRYHLQHNHYPPIPEGAIPFAEKAIAMVNEDDGESVVTIFTMQGSTVGTATLAAPDGHEATAYELVENWHLEGFLEDA